MCIHFFGIPCIYICTEFYRYLDIFTDAVPNVTLFDIERKTVLLAFTVVDINCRKKGSTNTWTFSELDTTLDIKKKDNDKRGRFSLKIKTYLGQSVFRRVVTISA